MTHACHHLAQLKVMPGKTGQLSARDQDILWFLPVNAQLASVQPEDFLMLYPDGRLIDCPDTVDPASNLALLPYYQTHQALYCAQTGLGAIILANPLNASAWVRSAVVSSNDPNSTHSGFISLAEFHEPVFTGINRHQPLASLVEDFIDRADFSCQTLFISGSGFLILGDSLTDAIHRLEALEFAASLALLKIP